MMVSDPLTSEPVLVIGAGPAGATAARRLALEGCPVRLVDRSAFPRNKPCGGGISIRAVDRFPYLRPALGRIGVHQISRLYLEGPDGESTVIESDGPAALMIRRVEFDALLTSLAVDAGAELVTGFDVVQASQDGDRVTLTSRDGRTLTASTVIAADGVHSVVARRLGLNSGWPATSIALDMMEETPRTALRDLDPSTLWVAYGYEPRPPMRRSVQDGGDHEGASSSAGRRAPRELSKGYAYIFPKRDHVNIGIGYLLSDFRNNIDISPYDLQRGFVERLRSGGFVSGESVRQNFTPFLIPVGGPLRRPGRGRVLLAGDAGGFVNGFTAEGIYYAMVSGEHAARIVAGAPRSAPDLVESYRRAVQHEIGAELNDSMLIQRYLFGDRRRIARVIRAAPRARAVTREILDFAMGRRSYSTARRRILTRSPLLAFSLVAEKWRSRHAD